MKKLTFLLTVPLIVGALYGCNKDEVKNISVDAPVEEDAAQQVNENATEINSFAFTQFSLDVDYSATESYEVDYENKTSGMEAELEDDRNNEKLRGDQAYTKLEPLFKQLTFDSTTPNDGIIEQIIAVFHIAEDYQSIEVEVKFVDGTEREFKRMK